MPFLCGPRVFLNTYSFKVHLVAGIISIVAVNETNITFGLFSFLVGRPKIQVFSSLYVLLIGKRSPKITARSHVETITLGNLKDSVPVY